MKYSSLYECYLKIDESSSETVVKAMLYADSESNSFDYLQLRRPAVGITNDLNEVSDE